MSEGAFREMFLHLARPWVPDDNLVAADLFSINDIDQARPFILIGIVLATALVVLVPWLGPALRFLIVAVVGMVFTGLRFRARLRGAPSHLVVALTTDRLVLLASRFRTGQWKTVGVFGTYPLAEIKATQGKDPFGLTLTLPSAARPLRLQAKWPSEQAARILRTLTGT